MSSSLSSALASICLHHPLSTEAARRSGTRPHRRSALLGPASGAARHTHVKGADVIDGGPVSRLIASLVPTLTTTSIQPLYLRQHSTSTSNRNSNSISAQRYCNLATIPASTTNRFTNPDQPRLIPKPPPTKSNPQQNKPTMAAALQQPPPAPPALGIPQFAVPCQAALGRRPAQPPHHDASHCHPVFFTDKLRRPPFSVLSGPHSSPVAHGYVYQDAPRGGEKAAGPRL